MLDEWLNAVDRRIGPLDRGVPALRIARQQRFAPLADILDDRTALEDVDGFVAEARHLVERLVLQIACGPLAAEKAQPVIEPSFLECPSNAQVLDQSTRTFRNPGESGHFDCGVRVDRHRSAPP